MATASVSPEQHLVIELGKRHPDYIISLMVNNPVSVYPLLYVTNNKYEVSTQIFLARNYWTVSILDRLVKKSIKRIEELASPNNKTITKG